MSMSVQGMVKSARSSVSSITSGSEKRTLPEYPGGLSRVERAQLRRYVIPSARSVEVENTSGDNSLFEHRSGNLVNFFPDLLRKRRSATSQPFHRLAPGN